MAKRGRKPIPKTQKELSQELTGPAYDTKRGNPNNASYDETNRGNQLSFKDDTTKPLSIGIQDIDESIQYYFQNVIKPTAFQNEQEIPIPIIYGSPERWKGVQKDGYYRDRNGKIMAPLIMFKRNSVTKNRTVGNKLDANNPHNYGIYGKKYSKTNEYDNFSILTNRKPIKTIYAVVYPDYVTIDYSCIIYTYYIEQMNKIVESINYASDSYWGNPERFKFRARIDSYTTNTTVNQGEDRLIKTNFNIKLYGYIIPNTINKEVNSMKKYNTKNLKIEFKVENTINSLNNNKDRKC